MNSPSTIQVPRLAGLAHDGFVTNYLNLLQPVILTDATTHWPALTKWTPEFFKHEHSKAPLTIDGKQYCMAEFIDLVLASSLDKPAPYLHNHLLEAHLPELLADINPMPRYTAPNWFESRLFPSKQNYTFVELYIGGTGARFPELHYDGLHTHAYLMQIQGVKEYVFYPPEQTPLVYPRQGRARNSSSVGDIEHPDLEKFPLFAKTRPIHCRLHPGETLFVPAGWWHTARILSTSVTVSVNSANTANWRDFVFDYCEYVAETDSRLRSYLLKPYLRALGLLAPLLGLS